jgi:hypothetical protein
VRALALALALLAGGAACAAPAVPFAPVDTAASQPEFFAYRARLQAIVARHDVDALLEELDPGIVSGFDGHDDLAGFRNRWKLDGPDSALWETLAATLALGGDFDEGGAFEAPYVASAWPEDLDAFDHVAIVGANVRVHAAPAADAAVVDTLGFAIVERAEDDDPDDAWTQIVLPGGGVGFVDARYTRSAADHRARFEHRGGRWRLVAFVAGD